MTDDRDITRIVRSWLEEADPAFPERVLDDVLDHLPATPQRRARRPAWRLNTMTTPIKFAAAAAAIGVLAVVVGIVPRTAGPGNPNLLASPSPSPSPSASPAPLNGRTGPLVAGTYRGTAERGREQWTVTVPDGWEDFYSFLWSDVDGQSTPPTVGGPGEVALGWESPVNVFADPCHWKDSLADPPVGPTVDDLATAFLESPGREVSGPTDVVFGGYPAKKVELSMPADLDVTTCDQGQYRVFLGAGESLDLRRLRAGPGPPVHGAVHPRGRWHALGDADMAPR